MSIRDEIRAENRKNFKEMPFDKKIKHFWHYYKIHTIVAIALIAFVIYIILLQTVLAPKPVGFSVYALSSNYYLSEDTSAVDALIQNFAAGQKINTEEYQIIFDVSNTIDPNSTDMLDMAVDMNIVKAGQDGNLDVLIGSEEQIDFYVINGFYGDPLDILLPADLFRDLDGAGLIYYYYDEESDKEYPIGIYVTDAPRFTEIGLYDVDTKVVLSIVSLSKRTDTAVEFVKYIFETP